MLINGCGSTFWLCCFSFIKDRTSEGKVLPYTGAPRSAIPPNSPDRVLVGATRLQDAK